MSSESRIWEIRPFGSMRGGRESVIGLVPLNPTSPAYSTDSMTGNRINRPFFGPFSLGDFAVWLHPGAKNPTESDWIKLNPTESSRFETFFLR